MKNTHIFAANHETYYDGVVLGLYLRFIKRFKLGFVTKEEILENNFIWRFFIKRCPHVVIKRDNPQGAIGETAKLLKSGCNIFMFPEGTTFGKKEGRLLKGKTGVIRIALEAGSIPIVPVGLRYLGFKRPFKFIRKICLGKPFHVKPFKNYENLRKQTDDLMREIAKLAKREYKPALKMQEITSSESVVE